MRPTRRCGLEGSAPCKGVMPAQAGIHATGGAGRIVAWVPAFVPEARLRHDAGMTLESDEPMNLDPTDEQRQIVATVRRFVREEIVPLEAKLDPDASELPREDFERLTKMVR